MRSSWTNPTPFHNQWLIVLEQWAALLLGILCLGVSLWAGFQGRTAFSAAHPTRLAEDALTAMKWFLTIAVNLSGVALLRFACHKPAENKAGTGSA